MASEESVRTGRDGAAGDVVALTRGARLCGDLAARLPYVQRHGSGCMAYSTLADGIEAFHVADAGYVAFARHRLLGERIVVLSDPVADPERWGEVLDRFLAAHPGAVFVQIGERAAGLLRERGRYVNEMGIETEIAVQDFRLSWRKRKTVTGMYNVAARASPVLRELPAKDVPRARLQAISDEWIATRTSSRREMSFLARPAVFDDEPGVRKFYAFVQDEIVGFAYFSPMYRDGAVVGYSFDIHRQVPDEPPARTPADGAAEGEAAEDANERSASEGTRIPGLLAKGVLGAPRGLSYWVLVEAMNVFRAEGVRTLSLGLSPLFGVDDAGEGHSAFTRWLFRASYRRLDWLYRNTGNALYKTRWKGTQRKVYVALRGRYPVLDVVALYRLVGVL
jgi:phosphatidylglycerol lysyltransferase